MSFGLSSIPTRTVASKGVVARVVTGIVVGVLVTTARSTAIAVRLSTGHLLVLHRQVSSTTVATIGTLVTHHELMSQFSIQSLHIIGRSSDCICGTITVVTNICSYSIAIAIALSLGCAR